MPTLPLQPFKASSPLDHGSLTGLGDDDHTQYLLLAGRSGGQVANGGTGASEVLRLRGSTDSNLGFVDIESPVTVDVDYTDTGGTQQIIDWATTIPSSGGAVTSFMLSRPTITVDNAVFILSAVRDLSDLEWTVSPGFAVSTLFLAQPNYRSSTSSVAPAQAFIYAAQAQMQNDGAGAGLTVPTHAGVVFTPRMSTTTSGDTLTVTNHTGLSVGPSYSTVAGTTVNFGTVRGVLLAQPAQGLFQPGAGTETMTAYYGLDMPAMTFGGAGVERAAVRSALAASSNNYCILNTSTAWSDFGSGIVHLNDNTPVQFGGGVNTMDASLFWSTTSSTLDLFFINNSDRLRFSNPANTRFLIQGNAGVGAGGDELNLAFSRFSIGAQTTAVGNQVGIFVAGAQTVGVAGEWSDFLLTQAANLDLNGNAMSTIAAWTLNPRSLTLSGGSAVTNCVLRVQGNPGSATTNRVGLMILSNPSGGSGVNAALWLTAGRARFDGPVDINNGVALGGGAAATLGTIGGSGPTTAAQAQWVQIEIGGTTHWIPAWT